MGDGRANFFVRAQAFCAVFNQLVSFLIGWLAGGRDVRPFGREDKPLVQCSISWCAVARSCLVQLFVLSEQAKKPGD